jgi:prepilin-type N-terminal cleavage/methylation domain-containing protein
MRAARGFTLLELLVAIGLAALVTMLGGMLLRLVLTADERIEERLHVRESVRDAYRLLDHYLLHQRAGSSLQGDAGSLVVQLSGLGGIRTIVLDCQPATAPDRFNLVLYRLAQEIDLTLDDPLVNALAEPLVDDLRHCRFGYLAPPLAESGDAPASWQDHWPAGYLPPPLLRLDLTTRHGILPPHIAPSVQPASQP